MPAFFSTDLTTRSNELEIMDTVQLPLPVMKETLDFLLTTNRYFGGISTVLNHFKKWSLTWPRGREIHILDVGTGGGEISIALIKWARKNNFNLRVTAIDLVPEIINLAKENCAPFPEISVRQEDIWTPSPDEIKFDYTIASLFLHHMPADQWIDLLKKFDSLSTRGILISDLVRSRPSYWAVHALSHLIGNYVVRNDGPLSVRRAFRVEDLTQLARDAGLSYLRAQREPWFRITLAGEK